MGGEAFRHTPVMAREVVEYLQPQASGVYCDATLGGGGHAELILEASMPDGRLIGIDHDRDALEAARDRLERYGERAIMMRGNFGQIEQLLADIGPVDGFLLDLGVSSFQLDAADRGFSLRRDGSLDMRMDQSDGPTARDLIEDSDENDLAQILREYGEVSMPRRVARALKRAVDEGIDSTVEVAERIKRVLPKLRKGSIHPATTVFQALRIAVNAELDVLERFLEAFPRWLKTNGRIVVIAYHSLEDRLVKNRFRELSRGPTGPADLYPDEPREATLEILTRKPLRPTDDEVEANPRARSARLRAARMRI
ncbi:MAG: 16S rRNA (cytosine(1402)-N(4))-methyltransferase RsmH [Myxococcales bacterium]|nr:16S rRNA (cytosine(1402)-N(4))-methyltransferase RsmH [Myxococcales bacterium]